mgnify:CR=1 FL=1
MAKKKTKKRQIWEGTGSKKRRTLQDSARDLQKSQAYSNKKLKASAGKAWKYMKENPYEVALGVAMMHPGVRVGAGLLKAGKALKKGAKATAAGAKTAGGKKIASGAPIRKALGTKVKGQGKTYKTRAQAEVAAGGTKRMKGATIDKVKGGYQVNPSRGNVMKSPKTMGVGVVTLAEIQRRRNKAAKAKDVEGGGLTKKKKKTKKKTTTTKRKTYKSVESNYKRTSDNRGTRVTTSTPRANQRRTTTVKKKAKTKKKLHGSEIFRRRLGGRRGY